MASTRRASTRTKKKTKRPRISERARLKRANKRREAGKPPQVSQSKPELIPEQRGREIFSVTIDSIRGDTAIGDLLVFFPRTRDVLVRKGLRLEAEDAGDIYMTLDAFSAMHGLETERLVQEVVEVARTPLQLQNLPQTVASAIP